MLLLVGVFVCKRIPICPNVLPFPTIEGHLEHSLGHFLECDGGVCGGDGVLGAVLGGGVGSPRGDDSSLLEPFVRLTELQHEHLIIIHFIQSQHLLSTALGLETAAAIPGNIWSSEAGS